MSEAAVAEATFSESIKSMGDQIAKLTLLQAVELSDYLDRVHNIKAQAGGMMMAPSALGPAAAPAEAAPEQTEFTVMLDAFGGNKIQVIKVVRAATGLGLKEAKDLVEGAPKPVKEAVSKEDAEKLKKELEEAGATVSIK